METLETIRRFVRVAELASFTQAADQLNLPKASISNAVQQLETHLGTQLLHRTTRKVQLTPDGQQFYERSKHLLTEMDELTGMFLGEDADLGGIIRVDMSHPMARNLVIPRLPELLDRYPRLQVELSSTDRRVDLVAEGYDCVVRTGQLSDSGLVVRPVGVMTQKNFASPDYLARHGTPRTLADLEYHWLIHYHVNAAERFDAFEYWNGRVCRKIPMKSRVAVNNTDAYRAACVAGLGIIQAPALGAADLIDAGRLVPILEDHPAPSIPVSLLYPHKRNLSKRVRVFMDWLSEILGQRLD